MFRNDKDREDFPVRYIHLNPVRAGRVENLFGLDFYLYCGHIALIGKKGRLWQDVDYVLGYFGNTDRRARKQYFTYVDEGFSRDDVLSLPEVG